MYNSRNCFVSFWIVTSLW